MVSKYYNGIYMKINILRLDKINKLLIITETNDWWTF